MMRKIPILFAMISFGLLAFADEFKVKLEGGGMNGSFKVTANETSCGRLNWDGVPDRSGTMSGGQYEILIQMTNNVIVITERTLATHKGVGSDITAKTTIPISRTPWTGVISQTTATVYRTQAKEQ